MEREIEWTPIASANYERIINYLKGNLPNKIAGDFEENCLHKIELLRLFPLLGKKSEKDTTIRKLVITKHNLLYYFVEEKKIVLLNFFDTRQEETKNKYQ